MYIKIILCIFQFFSTFSYAENLPPRPVMQTADKIYHHAIQHKETSSSIIAVVDYEISSNQPRMWIIDMKTHTVLENVHVAHGRNSGNIYAETFSNQPRSLKSSIGVFKTSNTYFGIHGKSIRLNGLEPGINDNAYNRGIVIHGAYYIHDTHYDNDNIRHNGRSFGCPAVSPTTMKALNHHLKPGSLFIAYYPDQYWLKHSKFL